MVKDTMSILLLYLWGLLGLGPILSCHPVKGRELQSNNTVYVPGLFDLSTFDFGEEIYEFTVSLINNHSDGWFDDILNDGTELTWSVADSACDGDIAVRKYWEIRTQNRGRPHGLVGCRCSDASIAVAMIAGLEEVPQVSPSSTSDKLSDTTKYPFFSRVISSEEPYALVSMLRSFGWSRVTILSTDTLYGKDQENEFRRLWLNKHNDSSGMWEGEVAYSHTILLNPNDTVNEASVKQGLGGVPTDDPTINSRVILLIAHDQHAYHILRIATESNFQPETIWVGAEAWVGRTPPGDLSWLPEFPGYIGLTPYRNRNEYYVDYLQRLQAWQERKGRSPWGELPDYAAEYLVDSILSITMALSNVPQGMRLNGSLVTTELQSLTFNGVSGDVAFTENGDRLHPRFSIFNLQRVGNALTWVDVGVAKTRVSDTTVMTNSICFAAVGCGVTEVPSDKYPVPPVPVSLLISVVIPIILVLLVAVTIFYCRTRQKRKRLKDSMTEIQKKMEAMKRIDGDLNDIDRQVEDAKRRQASLILQRAELQGMPDTWTEALDTIVEVAPEDKQYWTVLDRMRESMDDVYISKLWRVQNTSLWSYYSFHKDRLLTLVGGHGERDVWHGTSNLDPSVIYDDQQDGFMMQFAAQGFWGRGLYFADKASYSSHYAFTPPQRTLMSSFTFASDSRPGGKSDEKEMFLTKLLVGKEVFLDRDVSSTKANEYKKLTVPPVNKKTGYKYNTVTGNTGGSKVWVVYENGRAYPDYLVRYYRGARDATRTPYATKAEAMKKGVAADIEMGLKLPVAGSESSTSSNSCNSIVTWEYLDNKGWKPFSANHQSIIERHHQNFVKKKVTSSKVKINTDEWTYEVDVASFVQENIDHPGHRQREIRRRQA